MGWTSNRRKIRAECKDLLTAVGAPCKENGRRIRHPGPNPPQRGYDSISKKGDPFSVGRGMGIDRTLRAPSIIRLRQGIPARRLRRVSFAKDATRRATGGGAVAFSTPGVWPAGSIIRPPARPSFREFPRRVLPPQSKSASLSGGGDGAACGTSALARSAAKEASAGLRPFHGPILPRTPWRKEESSGSHSFGDYTPLSPRRRDRPYSCSLGLILVIVRPLGRGKGDCAWPAITRNIGPSSATVRATGLGRHVLTATPTGTETEPGKGAGTGGIGDP